MSISSRKLTISGKPLHRRFSRRQFLLVSGAVSGGALLAACAPAATPQMMGQEPIAVPTQQIMGQEARPTPAPDQMAADQTAVLTHPQLALNFFDPMSMGHLFHNTGAKYALWCSLVGMDREMNLFPWGATSWSFDEPNLTWTFNIREGMMFSDGTSITANDFAYSIKRSIRHLDPEFHAEEVAAGRAGSAVTFSHVMHSDIEGVQALRDAEITGAEWEEQYGDAVTATDDLTLQIRLAYMVPENMFMGKMAYNGSQVAKQADVEAGTPESPWFDTAATSGPYMFQEVVPDQYRVLVPNPHYGGGPAPYLEQVTLQHIVDAQTRLIAYENDEFDAVQVGEADALEYLREDHPRHDELTAVPLAVISYTWFVNLPPIDDVHVRRALIRSIDREQTVDAVFRGTARFSPTYIPDYTPGWEMPPNYDEVFMSFDPDEARRELEQSRYYDAIMSGELIVRLAFTQAFAQGTAGRLYEVYVDQWQRNLGIDVRLQQTEFEMEGMTESLQNVRTNGRGLLYADIDAWVSNVMALYDPAGQNAYILTDEGTRRTDIFASARIEDAQDEARFIQLWKDAARELDQEQRLRMYQEWEYLREKWAIEVPQYYPYFFVATQPSLRDLEVTPQAGLLFDRAWRAAA
jgi:peptide/nickel transport system substrate-binding protein